MQYEILNDDGKLGIVNANIEMIERDHFANTLALDRAKALDDNAQVESFEVALSNLEKQQQPLLAKRQELVRKLEEAQTADGTEPQA